MNPRNVVLCLLEVARIACTRHAFSPAPGLVEFEQEIDRQIQDELRMTDLARHCPESGDRNSPLRPSARRKLWDQTDSALLVSGGEGGSAEVTPGQSGPDDPESRDCGFVDDCGSCSSNSVDMRRSPSSNSVISSSSSTYLELNCGGSSTTSSTPTPMTSELDHKVGHPATDPH